MILGWGESDPPALLHPSLMGGCSEGLGEGVHGFMGFHERYGFDFSTYNFCSSWSFVGSANGVLMAKDLDAFSRCTDSDDPSAVQEVQRHSYDSTVQELSMIDDPDLEATMMDSMPHAPGHAIPRPA